MASGEIPGEVRQIRIEAPPLECVVYCCKVIRNVREAKAVEWGVRREGIVVDVSGCRIQVPLIDVTNPRRCTTSGEVTEVVAVPGIYQQIGLRRVITAEAVYRQGVDEAKIRSQRSRINSGAGVGLSNGTVRIRKLSRQTAVGVIPASKQSQLI